MYNLCESDKGKPYWYSNDSFSGYCVNKCPDNYVIKNKQCSAKCNTFGQGYDTDSKNCIDVTSCKNTNKHWLYDELGDDRGKCLDKCPDNYTIDGHSSMCVRNAVGQPAWERD
jgi:hypothetical protein